MPFDIKRYYEDSRNYYGDVPLDTVARDAFVHFGYDKKYRSYDDWKREAGITDQLEYDAMQRESAKRLSEPSGFLRRAVADPAVSLAKGVIGLGEAAVGLANIPTMGYAGKGLDAIGYRPKEAQSSLSELYSPEQQEANRKVQEVKGFVPTVTESLKNPSVIAHSVIESIPTMMGGGAIGRGLYATGKLGAKKAGQIIAGAAGEGLASAGSTAESIRQETSDKTLSPVQSLAAMGSGAATAIFGVMGGKLANRLGFDDIDTLMVGGRKGLVDPELVTKKKGIIRRVVESAISEGAFEELPQSAQEQMAQNVALGKPATEGVAEAAAQGMLAGMVMGGGTPAVSRLMSGKKKDPAIDNPATGVTDDVDETRPPEHQPTEDVAQTKDIDETIMEAKKPEGVDTSALGSTDAKEFAREDAVASEQADDEEILDQSIEPAPVATEAIQEPVASEPEPEPIPQRQTELDRLAAAGLIPQRGGARVAPERVTRGLMGEVRRTPIQSYQDAVEIAKTEGTPADVQGILQAVRDDATQKIEARTDAQEITESQEAVEEVPETVATPEAEIPVAGSGIDAGGYVTTETGIEVAQDEASPEKTDERQESSQDQDSIAVGIDPQKDEVMPVLMGKSDERTAQKKRLREIYPDYDPKYHDAFVERYNKELEDLRQGIYRGNRGVDDTDNISLPTQQAAPTEPVAATQPQEATNAESQEAEALLTEQTPEQSQAIAQAPEQGVTPEVQQEQPKAEAAQAPKPNGEWVKFSDGVQRYRIDGRGAGEVVDTKISYGNNSALRFETSDGERFESMREAKAHEMEKQIAPTVAKWMGEPSEPTTPIAPAPKPTTQQVAEKAGLAPVRKPEKNAWVTETKPKQAKKKAAPVGIAPQPTVKTTEAATTVSVPMSEKQEAGLSPKEQKKFLLAEVDKAIKVAKDEYTDLVRIEVPNDGVFQIKNSKDDLRRFRDAVDKNFPTSEAKSPKWFKKEVTHRSGNRISGEGVEYYHVGYEPYKADRYIKPSGKSKSFVDGGFYTNQDYAIQIDPSNPPKPTGKNGSDLKALIKEAVDSGLEDAELAGVYLAGGQNGKPRVHIKTASGKNLLFDHKYIDSIMSAFPKAKPFVVKNGWLAVFKQGNKVVGMAMPFEESDENIEALGSAREEALARTIITDANTQFQAVYHGTPHIWKPEPGFPHGRPRLDKIGTGEGAQAFGWGWYSAGDERVAKTYAEKNDEAIGVLEDRLVDEYNLAVQYDNDRRIYYLISDRYGKDITNEAPEGARKILDEINMGGELYTLDIPDDVIPKLLDWDKPLSEQSDYVKKALGKAGFPVDGRTAEEFYSSLSGPFSKPGGSQKAASKYLASIGIPGNKYLDGMSRDKGKGSYNYVIWDQPTLDRIALLERNGEALDYMRQSAVQSIPKGLPVADVEAHLAQIKTEASIPIIVFNGTDDPKLPKQHADVMKKAQSRGYSVRGFYRNQEVYVNAAGINALQDAETVVLHELIGHYGLLKMMGKEANPFFDRLWESKYGKEIRETGDRLKLDMNTLLGRRMAASEWFAETVQGKKVEPSLWTRFVAAFKDFLRRVGFSVEMGDAEIAELIRGAYEAARQKTDGSVDDRGRFSLSPINSIKTGLKNANAKLKSGKLKETIKSVGDDLRNFQENAVKDKTAYDKIVKPDLPTIAMYLQTPLYRKIPQLKEAWDASMMWVEDKVKHARLVLYEELDDGTEVCITDAMQSYAKANPNKWKSITDHLWKLDRYDDRGFKMTEKLVEDPVTKTKLQEYVVTPPKGAKAQEKSFRYENDAVAYAIESEAKEFMRKNPWATEDDVAHLKAFRRMTDRMFRLRSAELRAAQERARLTGEEIKLVWREGDNAIKVDLHEAINRMGDLRFTYVPRIRRSGKYQLVAEHPDGRRILEMFDVGAENTEGSKLKYLANYATPMQIRRRKLEKEGYNVKIVRNPSLPENVFLEAAGQQMALGAILEKAFSKASSSMAKNLKGLGIEHRWQTDRTTGDRYLILNDYSSLRGTHESLYEELGGKYEYKTISGKRGEPRWVFRNAPEDILQKITDRVFEMDDMNPNLDLLYAESMLNSVADVLRGRGAMGAGIHRSDEYWEGFETDPIIAITRSAQSLAGGLAKRQAGERLMKIYKGTTESWDDFVTRVENETGKRPMWGEYRKQVEERRVDPSQQKGVDKEFKSFMREILRNEEATDRVIGALNGLAVLKFLAFRVSSPIANLTALPTTAVGTLMGRGGIGMKRAIHHIGRGAKLAAQYYYGNTELGRKKFGKNPFNENTPESNEMKAVFDHIARNGWDQAQYNYEALAAIQGKLGKAYGNLIDWGMAMFGASERMNRMATIAGAYFALREKAGMKPGELDVELLKQAEDISNKAHGVYTKPNRPVFTRGADASSVVGRSLYLFQNYAHNYLLNMHDIGFTTKEQKKAVAYMLVSPMVVGGLGAGLAYNVTLPVINAILSAFGADSDDPEEDIYRWFRDNFGGGTENIARFGAFGALGINLKGSIGIGNNLSMPTKISDMFGAPGSMLTDFYEGAKDISKGNAWKGFEKMIPSNAVANVSAGIRMATEGATKPSNAPVFYGTEPLKMSATEAVMKAFSFNPAEYAKKREELRSDQVVMEKYREEKKDIADRYRRFWLKPIAQRKADDLNDIIADVAQYNNRLRTRGLDRVINPITPKSLREAIKRANRPTKLERYRQAGITARGDDDD